MNIRDTTHKLINHLDTPTLKPGDLEIKYIHQKKKTMVGCVPTPTM